MARRPRASRQNAHGIPHPEFPWASVDCFDTRVFEIVISGDIPGLIGKAVQIDSAEMTQLGWLVDAIRDRFGWDTIGHGTGRSVLAFRLNRDWSLLGFHSDGLPRPHSDAPFPVCSPARARIASKLLTARARDYAWRMFRRIAACGARTMHGPGRQ